MKNSRTLSSILFLVSVFSILSIQTFASFDVDGKSISFDVDYSTKSVPVEKREITITQSGKDFADIDSIRVYADGVSSPPLSAWMNGNDLLHKVKSTDREVVAYTGPITLVFPHKGQLLINAHEVDEGGSPARYPEEGFTSLSPTRGKFEFDGYPDEDLGASTFIHWWVPSSGHPEDSGAQARGIPR